MKDISHCRFQSQIPNSGRDLFKRSIATKATLCNKNFATLSIKPKGHQILIDDFCSTDANWTRKRSSMFRSRCCTSTGLTRCGNLCARSRVSGRGTRCRSRSSRAFSSNHRRLCRSPHQSTWSCHSRWLAWRNLTRPSYLNCCIFLSYSSLMMSWTFPCCWRCARHDC